MQVSINDFFIVPHVSRFCGKVPLPLIPYEDFDVRALVGEETHNKGGMRAAAAVAEIIQSSLGAEALRPLCK